MNFPCNLSIRAKTREKDTYIEFSMAGSLENRGKLRELIDKLQFAELTQKSSNELFFLFHNSIIMV